MSINRTMSGVMALLLSAAALTSAHAFDGHERWIDIANETGRTVTGVYATNVGDIEWGRNLLRGERLADGDTRRVEPRIHDGYCRFDLRVDLANGRQFTHWRVNLCRATALVCTSSGCTVQY